LLGGSKPVEYASPRPIHLYADHSNITAMMSFALNGRPQTPPVPPLFGR